MRSLDQMMSKLCSRRFMIEFERMQSVTVGFGGIKGSKYQFEGIEEKVKQRILDGWTYLGYVPIITRSTGDVETISLIFEKEETA